MWILNVPDIDQISGWYSALNIGQSSHNINNIILLSSQLMDSKFDSYFLAEIQFFRLLFITIIFFC